MTAGVWSGILAMTLALACIVGCATDSNRRIFDPTGRCLFNTSGQNSSCPFNTSGRGAKKVSDSKESGMASNTVGNDGTTGSPWAPTDAEAARMRNVDDQVTDTDWSTQRPNGGVLFPRKLPGPGPMVVLEPRSIVAPVGSEIVLVGSYVGPGCEYLRTDQSLEWNIDGTGHFLTTNPGPAFNCESLHSKKYGDKYIQTVTTNKLWRIHRGTATPADDISILKGQSWTTVQSGAEGTSNVTLLAPNIDNWTKRSATAQIHWIDASFRFPQSGIAPSGESQILSTTVVRRTDPNVPRVNWLVRYEVVSGPPAGFGPQLAQTVETATNDSGQSSVVLNQRAPADGTNRIAVSIIRPASASFDQTSVAEKTISQTWTTNAIFKINVIGPSTAKFGQPAPYKFEITNRSALAQAAIVRLALPPGITIVSSTPKSYVDQGQVAWILENVPAQSTVPINLELSIQTMDPFNLNPHVAVKSASNTLDPNIVVTPGVVTPTPQPISSPPISSPPISSVPASPRPVPSASTPPALSSPGSTNPPVGTGNVDFKMIVPFPNSAETNKAFDVIFTLANPGNRQIDKVVFSATYPPDVTLYVEGKPFNSSPTSFFPLTLSAITSRTFPFSFKASTPGPKAITLRAVDGNNTLVAEKAVSVMVSGAAAPTTQPGAAGRVPPRITMTMRSTSKESPNFTVGTTALVEFAIKNNENYAVSNLQLLVVPEQNRSLKPWKLKTSVPPNAAAIDSGQVWQLALPTLPAGSEQVMSVTIVPEKAVSNGLMSAQIQSPEFPNSVIANARFVYSVAAQRVQRPAADKAPETTVHVERPAAVPDTSAIFAENAPGSDTVLSGEIDVRDRSQGDGQSENTGETNDRAADTASKAGQAGQAESVIPSPYDGAPDEVSTGDTRNDPESKPGDNRDLDLNISVVPETREGKPCPVDNHVKAGETPSPTLSSRKAYKNRPFAYRITIVNEGDKAIDAGLLEMEILLPTQVVPKKEQPESLVFGTPEVAKRQLVYKSVARLEPMKPNQLVVELSPTTVGESVITLDISLKARNRLVGVYKLPLVIGE